MAVTISWMDAIYLFVLYHTLIRWEYVMEYSKDISSLLDNAKSLPNSMIDDPKTVLKVNLYFLLLQK